MLIAIRIAAYLAIVWLHWGIFYACIQGQSEGDESRRDLEEDEFRRDLEEDGSRRNVSAATLFFALVPPFWILAPFLTGFYKNGWRNPTDWKPRKDN